MLIDEKQFFEDALNLSIPEMAAARTAYMSGDVEGARKHFADYVRETLDAERFYNIAFVKKRGFGDPEDMKKRADAVVGGLASACGFSYQFPDDKVDWSINPTPNGYCEWPWQHNRFQMTDYLSKAYIHTKDPKYVKRFVYLIDSWIDQQPFPLVKVEQHASSYEHVGWRTIETGIRMQTSWQYPIHTFIRCPELSDAFIVKMFMSIWEHGFQLRRYGSSHNWLIIEMTGLVLMSAAYPFLKQCGKWLKFALQTLEDQLDVQLYPEGMQYELATGYHLGVAGLYLDVIDVCRAYDVQIPAVFHDKVNSMYTAILKLLQPDTHIPDLNDGTGQSAVPSFKYALEYFPEDEEMRFIVSGGKEGKRPAYNSIALDTVGLIAMRTGWEPTDMWALFDAAHFGWGHQHEDKLSFNLYAYGKRMLSDGGQYEYDSSLMRQMIISTRAHNTALVDTLDQNRRATFDTREEERKVRERIPSDLTYHLGEDYEVAEGTYDKGYGKKDALVMVDHHRKVIFFKKGLDGSLPFFVLIDRFTPQDEQEHLYEVLFQLGTEPITVKDNTVTADHGDGVTMSLIGSAAPVVLVGQYKPRYMGWRKDRTQVGTNHEHHKAPAVLFTESKREAHIVTVVYPSNAPEQPIVKVSASAPGEERSFTLTFADGHQVTICEDADEFATFDTKGNRYEG